MEKETQLIAKTFSGLEEVLAEELTQLGANNIEIGRRVVTFTGDKRMLYRANFCLRTAVRILVPIASFRAADPDEIYAAVKQMDWDKYLDLDTSFTVDSVVFSNEFRHTKYVAYKVKDAIVDYFREKTGHRPSISIANPDVRLNIHIAEDSCTLSLDSSGDSLHLRGYRIAQGEAPINEVLAAGILLLAGWRGETDLVDPFCGSGTFLIEAALIARGIWPGVFRKGFGFEKWKDFEPELLKDIYNDDSDERTFGHHIYGYDISGRALEGALANAKSAGVADCISLAQQDIRRFEQPKEPALMVTNPPYGQRLATPDILNLYDTLGQRLKHHFVGGEAWVISSSKEALSEIGLKPSRKIVLYNGPLDCELRKFQIFEGKMNTLRASGGDFRSVEDHKRNGGVQRVRHHDFGHKADDEETDYDSHANNRDRREGYRHDGYRASRGDERRNRSEHRDRNNVDHRSNNRRFDDRDRRKTNADSDEFRKEIPNSMRHAHEEFKQFYANKSRYRKK